MTTINKIASAIADDLGKPFDEMLLERIKFQIRALRTTLIRQEYERTGGDALHTQTLVVDVRKMDDTDTDCGLHNCDYTVADLTYRPLALKLGGPIFFAVLAQSNNRASFQHATLAEIRNANLRCIEDLRYYYYANNKLYFYNWPKLAKRVMLTAYWDDPDAVLNACVNNNCRTDDDEFDLGAHMIQTIITTLKSDLRQAPKVEVEHE